MTIGTEIAVPRARSDVPRRRGDRLFGAVSTSAAVLIVVTLAGVGGFLLWQAWPALTSAPQGVRGGRGLVHYIGPLAFGTVLSSALALLIATPLSIGVALFTTHYAPRRVARGLGYLIDLLAAIPSLVFGLWGIQVLAPRSVPVGAWLSEHLGFLPFFGGPASGTGRTMLVAAVVLAIMVLPIMTAVNREVLGQTPRSLEEASLALGATRWEMVRQVVLPLGRRGIVSGAMLGLGRALGETMAIAIILSPSARYTLDLVSSSSSGTIAADIALQFPESSGLDVSTLIASGLVLFVITMAVSVAARAISRDRSGSGGGAR